MNPAARLRDTDADWRHLGETDPYFGVVTDPRFRTEAMDAEALEAFYESGRRDVDAIVALVERVAGPPRGRALDVGCGVGRLAEAMAERGFDVTGYDISPGMLEKARARSGGQAAYVDVLPEGPFDWVNSYIVLQHVPPERGLELIGRMAGLLAQDGVLSLHLPFGSDPGEGGGPSVEERLAQAPLGLIAMYAYDLNAVFDRLWDRGLRRFGLEQVQHGAHRGFYIVGRRTSLL